MSKCNEQPLVLAGCLNGVTPIMIHIEHFRYSADDVAANALLPTPDPKVIEGNLKGVNMYYTDARGVPVVVAPLDTVSPGSCDMIAPPGGGTQDWELVFYHNTTNPAERCRKIALVRDEANPTQFDAFEFTGDPVAGFDPAYILDQCPCKQRTPAVVW